MIANTTMVEMRTVCEWVQDDDDSDAWGTQCRRMFIIIDGTPTDNRMTFCCYCGKPLVEGTR